MRKLIIVFILFAVKISGQTTYVVTSANDPVDPFSTVSGELRWAIEQANANPGADIIEFNITGSYSSPITIDLNTELPWVTDPLTMDGNTQTLSGYSGSEPKIIIDGASIPVTPGVSTFGLHSYFCDGSIYSNLQLSNFGNAFRTGYSGGNTFTGNVCLNDDAAFYISEGGTGNVFHSNYINTDHSLTSSGLYASSCGIWIIGSTTQESNKIGGLNPGENNFFFNCGSAVQMSGANSRYNSVFDNIFISNSKNIDLSTGYLPDCGNTCKAAPTLLAFSNGSSSTVQGGALANDVIQIYKSNAGGVDAIALLATITADGSGNFSTTISGLLAGDKVLATATDVSENTSEFSAAISVIPSCCSNGSLKKTGIATYETLTAEGKTVKHNYVCLNSDFSLELLGCNPSSSLTYSWDFGDGSPVVTTTYGGPVAHQYTSIASYPVKITVSGDGCLTVQKAIIEAKTCSCEGATIAYGRKHTDNCKGDPIELNVSCQSPYAVYNWDMDDGTTFQTTSGSINHTYANAGSYNVQVHIVNPPNAPVDLSMTVVVDECVEIDECKDCITSFAPEEGDYIISLWVKEDGHATHVTEFSNTGVRISFVGVTSTPVTFFPDDALDKIIDGWQRISGKFAVPAGAQKINIELQNNNPAGDNIDSYFDDLRVHPLNSSFKSYVYDPVSMRLVAELDERNYATFYEYDEEGQLIRVKKETEKGIKTIKETRTSVKK